MALGKQYINQRFINAFQYLEKRGMIRRKVEAAKLLGIEPQRLNEILKGRMHVATDVLTNFFIHYKVNPYYIFFETPPLLLETTTDTKEYSDAQTQIAEAAEEESKYKKLKGKAEIMIRQTGKDGSERIEYLSVSEFGEMLGLKELEEKLVAILNELKGKKQGGQKK